jgi:hypothetical protein
MESEDLKKADPRALRRLATFLGLKEIETLTNKQVKRWIKLATRPLKISMY